MHPLVILAQNRYLETSRLYLRPMDVSDLEDYHAYTSDDDLLKYDYPAHRSLSESLEGLVLYNLQSPLGRFGIVHKETGRLIGNISLRLTPDEPTAFIGYTVNRDYHGQAYATEAVQALLDLTEKLPLQTILAKIDERNSASRRVVEKCGFVLTKSEPNTQNLRGELVTYLTYSKNLTKKEEAI